MTFFIGNKINIIVVYSGRIKKEFYLLENSVNFKDVGWQTVLWPWNLFPKWLYEVNKIHVYLLTVPHVWLLWHREHCGPFFDIGVYHIRKWLRSPLIYAAKEILNNKPGLFCLFTLFYFISLETDEERSTIHISHKGIIHRRIY